MTKIALPVELTTTIAQYAVQNARQFSYQRGWSSADFINPYAGPGFAGMQVTRKYLMYQEKGTPPRVMTELEGKLVPIKGADGQVHVVRAKGVGQPGWVTLPGGVKKWRQQKWRHPGIKPTNFMHDSIDEAVKQSHDEILQFMANLIGGPR